MPEFDLDAALTVTNQSPLSLCCGTALLLEEIDTRDAEKRVLWARATCSTCQEEHSVRYTFAGYTSAYPAVQAKLDALPDDHFNYFNCPMCGGSSPESLDMVAEPSGKIGADASLPFRWHNVMWCLPCGHYEEHFESEGRPE